MSDFNEDRYFSRVEVLESVGAEVRAQDDKWGVQNHPCGTGLGVWDARDADISRELCNNAAERGDLTWRLILQEEVSEAFAEMDEDALVVELIQVAAVAVNWIMDIRSR